MLHLRTNKPEFIDSTESGPRRQACSGLCVTGKQIFTEPALPSLRLDADRKKRSQLRLQSPRQKSPIDSSQASSRGSKKGLASRDRHQIHPIISDRDRRLRDYHHLGHRLLP